MTAEHTPDVWACNTRRESEAISVGMASARRVARWATEGVGNVEQIAAATLTAQLLATRRGDDA